MNADLNNRKIYIWCFLILFIVSASSAEAETITYKDKLGWDATVKVPVRSVVFFQTYELIPSLGIWDKVVGISRWAYENDLMLAAKPDIKKTIPSAGSGTDVNIEAILKLKPELVITWTWNPNVVWFMQEKGLTVISIYPESLQELYDVMRLHGRLFKKEKKMEQSIAEMERIFSIIRERVSKIPSDKRKKVVWLGSKPTSIACGIGVTNDIFNLIGGINVAGKIPQRNADFSMEQILSWNPDVIFIWGNANYKARDILENSQWDSLKAVKEGRVYKSPKWSTWSTRLAPIALWMAMKTYPEYFHDINYEKITDNFYRKVFGIPYSKVKQIEP